MSLGHICSQQQSMASKYPIYPDALSINSKYGRIFQKHLIMFSRLERNIELTGNVKSSVVGNQKEVVEILPRTCFPKVKKIEVVLNNMKKFICLGKKAFFKDIL